MTPEDPRLVRTRGSLRAALRRLLPDRPLDDISVSLLCREAGVHRTTFYGHATSVRQFAMTEFSEDIERMATVPVRPGEETPEHVAHRYDDSLQSILRHVAADRLVYRALFASDSRGAFRAALEAGLRPRAASAIRVFAVQGVAHAPTESRECDEAAAFVAGGLVGAIDVWALSDDEDVETAAARVRLLMPRWWPDTD